MTRERHQTKKLWKSLFLSSLFFICRGISSIVTSKAMALATSKWLVDVRLGPGSKLLCGDDDDDPEEGGGVYVWRL